MRSVKHNKLDASSQLDCRIELINLSILCLDQWTERRSRVHRRGSGGGGVGWEKGTAVWAWACVTCDITEGSS